MKTRLRYARLLPVEDVTAPLHGPLDWKTCQRARRHRPAGEPFQPERHGVEIVLESEARPFVEREHYAGTWVASRLSVALYRCPRAFLPGRLGRAEMVGACVFGVPMQPAVIPCYAPERLPAEGVELSRLVLLDHVEGNAESWFVARALGLLQRALPEVRAVISYSDPVLRRRADGSVGMPGHIGTVYKSLNARYFGRGSSETSAVAEDGTTFSRRTLNKLRNDEVGGASTYERLRACGAPPIRPGESGNDYVCRTMLEGPFYGLPHPGNHVYGWALDGQPLAQAALEGAPRKRGRGGLELVARSFPPLVGGGLHSAT